MNVRPPYPATRDIGGRAFLRATFRLAKVVGEACNWASRTRLRIASSRRTGHAPDMPDRMAYDFFFAFGVGVAFFLAGAAFFVDVDAFA